MSFIPVTTEVIPVKEVNAVPIAIAPADQATILMFNINEPTNSSVMIVAVIDLNANLNTLNGAVI